MHKFCVAAVILLGASSVLRAQSVAGSVVATASGAPLAGAVISIHSGRALNNEPLVSTISGPDGAFRLTVPTWPSTPVLLVRYIGYAPTRIDLPFLAAGADTTVLVTLERLGQVLPPIAIRDSTSCPQSSAGIRDVAALWDAVSVALENSRISRNIFLRHYDFVSFRRERDALDGRYLSEIIDTANTITTRPFRAASVNTVRAEGYVVYEWVVEESTRGRRVVEMLSDVSAVVFLAPDEVVLLDRQFQDTHCFWATAASLNAEGLIGLHFVPVDTLSHSDISGAFWLDANSFELRRLSFNYTRSTLKLSASAMRGVGANAAVRPDAQYDNTGLTMAPSDEMLDLWIPGGNIEYQRQRTGSFVVNRWHLWAADTWTRAGFSGEVLARPTRINESGGEILRVGGGLDHGSFSQPELARGHNSPTRRSIRWNHGTTSPLPFRRDETIRVPPAVN